MGSRDIDRYRRLSRLDGYRRDWLGYLDGANRRNRYSNRRECVVIINNYY